MWKLYLVVSTLACLAGVQQVSGARKRVVPKRCCSPDQFIADIKNTASTYKFCSVTEQPDVKLGYDWTNRRWAIEWRNPENETSYWRFASDFTKGYKIGVQDNRCIKTELTGSMERHCISENSTYDGDFTYGTGDNTLRVNQWSYPFGIYPTKSTRLTTHKNCYPVQDLTGLVTKNTVQWDAGDDPCIPWEDPRMVTKGKCYKSYKKRRVEKTSIDFSAPLIFMEYRNLDLGITSPELFETPEGCQDVTPEEWGQNFKIMPNYDLWRGYNMRFNPHNPIKDGMS